MLCWGFWFCVIEVSSRVLFHIGIKGLAASSCSEGVCWGRKTGLAETEDFGWLFVDVVPLLYSKKKVERQLKVEEWLDLYALSRELGIGKSERSPGGNGAINYVV